MARGTAPSSGSWAATRRRTSDDEQSRVRGVGREARVATGRKPGPRTSGPLCVVFLPFPSRFRLSCRSGSNTVAWRRRRAHADARRRDRHEGKERTPSTHTRFSTCRTVSLKAVRAPAPNTPIQRGAFQPLRLAPDVASRRDHRHPVSQHGIRVHHNAHELCALLGIHQIRLLRVVADAGAQTRPWRLASALKIATWPACGGFQDPAKSTRSPSTAFVNSSTFGKLPDGRAVEAVEDPYCCQRRSP